jgi:CelD/BcsL family acetyltransferase involved in cellulose biosynthesis
LTVHNDESVFEQLDVEWNALLERSKTGNVFSTWEWQSTWWNAYHPGTLWIVTCRDDENRLLGIAPCFVVEDNGKQVLSFIGCVDVTDYLDFIIDKEHIESVLSAFARFFAQHRDAFDHIDLCNFPQVSPTLQCFPQMLEQSDFVVRQEQLDVCPGFAVPENWSAYLDNLHKKQRHELRRKMRRAYGANVEIDWYIVGDEHDLYKQIDIFTELMAASDTDKEAFLKDESNLAFFHQIVPILQKQGWLQLAILTIGGKPAAAYLNIVYRNRVMVYNSGLLRGGDYDHLSGGIVLLANLIQYAIDHNYDYFDFLRGNETYKYHMGGEDSAVYAVRAYHHTESNAFLGEAS